MNASFVKIDVRNSMNVTKLGLKQCTVGIKYLVKAQTQAHLWGGGRKDMQSSLFAHFLIFTKATLKMEEDSS